MLGVIVCGIGTISKELIPYLVSLNYKVTVVTRNTNKSRNLFNDEVQLIDWMEIQTNPKPYFSECIAVINLARPALVSLDHPTFGMSADQIEVERDRFLAEGAVSTEIMAFLCAQHADPKSTVFLNASAYDHYDSQTSECEPASDLATYEPITHPQSFFTKLIQAWELEAEPAIDAGIRVVHLGLGMIIDKNSTGFSTLLSFFQMGIGGPIGSGEQYIPMLTMRDAIAAITHCIGNINISGYVNIAGFNVKQKHLAQELAKQVAAVPVSQQGWGYTVFKTILFGSWLNNIPKPEILIKFFLGTFSELLLKNVRIQSEKLLQSGFVFRDNEVVSALTYALSKPADTHAYLDLPSSSAMGMSALGGKSSSKTSTADVQSLRSVKVFSPIKEQELYTNNKESEFTLN